MCYLDSQHQLLSFCPHGHEAGTTCEDQVQVLPKPDAETAIPGSGPRNPGLAHRASSLLCPRAPQCSPRARSQPCPPLQRASFSLLGGATMGTGLERKRRKQQRENGGGHPSAISSETSASVWSVGAQQRTGSLRWDGITVTLPFNLGCFLITSCWKGLKMRFLNPIWTEQRVYKSLNSKREMNQSSLS